MFKLNTVSVLRKASQSTNSSLPSQCEQGTKMWEEAAVLCAFPILFVLFLFIHSFNFVILGKIPDRYRQQPGEKLGETCGGRGGQHTSVLNGLFCSRANEIALQVLRRRVLELSPTCISLPALLCLHLHSVTYSMETVTVPAP